MKTTVSIKKEQFEKGGDLQREWFLVDAENQTLGRLASQISKILIGKHKPIYTPHTDTGDYIVVINSEKIKLSGKKWTDKLYYRHTGYPGGLKTSTALDLFNKNPNLLITNAVKGMMPKNKLCRQSINKLKVYSGSDHPHIGQNPQKIEL